MGGSLYIKYTINNYRPVNKQNTVFRIVNKDYSRNIVFVQQLFKIYLKMCEFLKRKQETYGGGDSSNDVFY